MQKGAKILIKVLFIIYIGMVLFFCFYKFSSPSLDLGKYFLGIRMDRYAHFIMFFPYPFISWLSCRYASKKEFWKKYALVITIVSGLIFAACTEICQDLIFKSRQGDIFDFAADAIGIICGSIIVHFTGKELIKLILVIFPKSNPEHEKK